MVSERYSLGPETFIREIRKPIRRNPLITRTLYYSKDMESFATGLKRIQDACDQSGCKVEYYGDNYGFTVRFYRHCGEGWGDAVQSVIGNAQADSMAAQVTTQVTTQVTAHNKEEILNRLIEFCNIPRSKKELMDYVGLSNVNHFRKS